MKSFDRGGPNFAALQQALKEEVAAAYAKWRQDRDQNVPFHSLRFYPTGRAILALPPESQVDLLLDALRNERGDTLMRQEVFCPKNIARALMKKVLPLTASQVLQAIAIVQRWEYYLQGDLDRDLLAQARPHRDDADVCAGIETWRKKRFPYGLNSADDVRSAREFQAVLSGVSAVDLVPTSPWELLISDGVGDSLYHHLRQATQTKMSKKWRDGAVSKMPPAATLSEITRGLVKELKGLKEAVSAEPSDVLRGYSWLLGLSPEDTVHDQTELALACVRKVPNYGTLCQKAVLALIDSIAFRESFEATAGLIRIRNHSTSLKAFERATEALEAAAKKQGLTLSQLEANTVPSFDLGPDGMHEIPTSEGMLQLQLTDRLQVQLRFIRNDGKELKSLPKTPETEALKVTAKGLKELVLTQRNAIERLFLSKEAIPYSWWKTHTQGHPVVGRIARLLIWEFAGVAAEIHGGRLRTVTGETIEPDMDSSVRLWHPVPVSEEDRLQWRKRVEEWPCPQPFKQAHRELYSPTGGEAVDFSSDRFSGHVVRQHQLLHLARSRGWTYGLQSANFDSDGNPTLPLEGGMEAVLVVEPIEDERGGSSDQGISLHLITSQVQFRTVRPRDLIYTNLPDDELRRIGEIDPIVYSEVMRDIDLFVSVAGATHDPMFDRRATATSPNELSVTAQVRADVLGRLLPRLGLDGKFSINGRFVHVQGTLASYDIHLGSGSLFVHPGRAIAIEIESGPDTALPFEGDATLDKIVALARMLVNDATELDPSLRKQVEGS